MVRLTPVLSLASVALLAAPVASHEAYARKLPNGENVTGVKAIGHTDPNGGGIRNAFGRAFYDAGHAWTRELCMSDSDRDGQTNGEELGDPCCEWTEESAKAPLWTSGVSNPGDDASTSNKAKWPAYECSSVSSSSKAESASASGTDSDSGSSTSTAPSVVPAASVSAVLAFILALVV